MCTNYFSFSTQFNVGPEIRIPYTLLEFNKISLKFKKNPKRSQNYNFQNKNLFQPVTNYKKRSEFTN